MENNHINKTRSVLKSPYLSFEDLPPVVLICWCHILGSTVTALKKRYCMEFGRELPMKMSTCKWYKLQSEAVKGKALVKGHSPELRSFCLKFKKGNN
jgi:hypothetical protein